MIKFFEIEIEITPSTVERYKRVLIIVLLSVCFALTKTTVFSQGNTGDDALEKQALLDFYNATQGGSWVSKKWNIAKLQDVTTKLSDLLPGDLDNVVISNSDVIAINFPDCNNTVGSIPASFTNLTHLLSFQIISRVPNCGASSNQISGTLPNLNSLTSLQVLKLSNNACSGLVDWLNMSTLTTVDLSSDYTQSNHLTIDSSPFNTLTSLTSLTLNYNSFVSNQLSPNFSYLDNLVSLSMTNCGLTAASFPVGFGDMAAITTLDLSGNPIVNVPSPIGSLTTLVSLYLNNVSLQALPSNIGNLDNLQFLSLEVNNLSIANGNLNLYTMIELLKNCAVLQSLDLGINNLTDVSTNFSSLTALRSLSMNKNPIGSSAMPNLNGSLITDLSLNECQLTNSLPSVLTSLSQLHRLDIGNSGDYASNPGMINSLDLTQSGISSVLTALQYLTSLVIQDYAIKGPAPLPESWFGTGYMKGLTTLFLDYNQIQQPLPSNIISNTNLMTLSLSHNDLGVNADPSLRYLSPNFTCATGKLTNLTYLDVSNNQLVNLPSDGTTVDTPVPDLSACNQLASLNIASNLLTDSLPVYFVSSMPALINVNMASNSFTGVPAFYSRSNASMFILNAADNSLDFHDLDPFYVSSCASKIENLNYALQKAQGRKGDPATFYMPEDLSVTLKFSSPGDPHNYYQWERDNNQVVSGYAFDPAKPNLTCLVSVVTPETAGLYHTEIRNVCMPGLQFKGADITLVIIPPLCESQIPNGSGVFKLDKLTGSIVFERSDCPVRIPIGCAFAAPTTIDNVVSAKAITHSDNWSYSFLNLTPAANPFESGERGKWRQQATYVQNTALIQANDKNYNGGTFKLKTFNFLYGEKSYYPGWLKANEVKKYSQHGQPVEEVDALEIPSVAKFGYGETVPYIIAKNASYNSVLFESFENVYGSNLEDGFPVSSSMNVQHNVQYVHSGKGSLQVTAPFSFPVRKFNLEDLNNTGLGTLIVKVWVKGTVNYSFGCSLIDADGATIETVPFSLLSSSGEWFLYECRLDDDLNSVATLNISSSGAGTIYLDDLRVHSLGAEMTAYVYDPATLRLLAIFDDQNFGLFYQYNSQGKLVRKIVETEQGVRTVQETQYNLPKIPK